jgi:hypothetical protein
MGDMGVGNHLQLVAQVCLSGCVVCEVSTERVTLDRVCTDSTVDIPQLCKKLWAVWGLNCQAAGSKGLTRAPVAARWHAPVGRWCNTCPAVRATRDGETERALTRR